MKTRTSSLSVLVLERKLLVHGQLIELEKSLEKVARVANPGFAIKFGRAKLLHIISR
jgi:hypothetical protein